MLGPFLSHEERIDLLRLSKEIKISLSKRSNVAIVTSSLSSYYFVIKVILCWIVYLFYQ